MSGPRRHHGLMLAAAGAPDPYWANVVLLMQMNGANDGTTFTDSSTAGRTVTLVGSPVTKTGVKRWGTASALISTSTSGSNALTVPHDADFTFGTGDFTLEAWVYRTAAGPAIILQKGLSFDSAWGLAIDSSNMPNFYCQNTSATNIVNITGVTPLSTNTWYFMQGTRSGTSFVLSVNGTPVGGGGTSSASLHNNASSLVRVGNWSGSGQAFPGYIDDVRVTNGIARAHALPTAAFPDY